MSSYLDSSLPVLNIDRREPEIQQGVVLFKGMTDETAINTAIEKDAGNLSLYKIPRGDDSWKKQRTARVAFILIDSMDDIYHDNGVIHTFLKSDSVPCLQRLEGIGGSKEELYRTILPIGFVNNGNETNPTKYFNIQSGGTITYSNYSPYHIKAGDILIAELPDETKNNPYERYGKELMLKPYNPSIHKETPFAIRKCLDSINSFQSHHPKFQIMCENILNAKFKEFLLYREFMSKTTFLAIDTEYKSLFYDNTGNLKNPDQININALIGTQSYAQFVDLFFPRNNTTLFTNTNQNKLHKENGPAVYTHMSQFIKFKNSWIIGKALTTAAPGHDLTISIGTFSL
jgi:hypothetical protein